MKSSFNQAQSHKSDRELLVAKVSVSVSENQNWKCWAESQMVKQWFWTNTINSAIEEGLLNPTTERN
jgi:hypothetical protein